MISRRIKIIGSEILRHSASQTHDREMSSGRTARWIDR